jgi:hypothetical protein
LLATEGTRVKRPKKATGKSARKKLPKSVQESPFVQSALNQVPVDLWLACLDVYSAAASLRMPVQNPETRFVIQAGEAGYVPKDSKLNRGVMAVRDFVNDPQLNPAMLTRIMAFGRGIESARNDPQFAKFFEADSPDGGWMIGGPLLAAFALANMDSETLQFDMSSVLKIANEREHLDDWRERDH